MRAYPKTIPARSPKYLKWIREQLCLKCGAVHETQAAHNNFGHGGMGTKVSDLWVVPLCRVCHTQGEHQKGKDTFYSNIDVKLRCLEYLNQYVSTGGKF